MERETILTVLFCFCFLKKFWRMFFFWGGGGCGCFLKLYLLKEKNGGGEGKKGERNNEKD